MSFGASHEGNRERGGGREPNLSKHTLPPRPDERFIEAPLFSLRFREVGPKEARRIVSLTVETKHPTLNGVSPVFCLDRALSDGYQRSPHTLSQIVASDVTEATRREAIGVLVTELVRDKKLAQEIQRPVITAPMRKSSHEFYDELEPVFTIQTAVSTTFPDFVRGHVRRAVTVYRNDRPIVSFVVVNAGAELASAEIHVEPINIKWPLIDAAGLPVTPLTVDQAIHELTCTLRGTRDAMWAVSVHHLAHELERRQRVRLTDPDEFEAEPFLYQFMAAVPDDQLWGDDISRSPVALALAPNGRSLKPKQMPDGRVVWVGWDKPRSGSASRQIVLAGFSKSGGEFELSIEAPRQLDARMKVFCGDLLNAASWQKCSRALDRVCALPGIRVQATSGKEAESYPSVINALIDEIKEMAPDASPSRGAPFDALYPNGETTREKLEPYLQGKSPFAVVLRGKTPATTWCVEASLDEELTGGICCTNSLGGMMYLGLERGTRSLASQRAVVREIFLTAAHTPALLGPLLEGIPDTFYRREMLPEGRTRAAYAQLDQLAAAWERELFRMGVLREFKFAGEIPWWVEPLEDNRFNLSILPVKDSRLKCCMNHSLVVGARGVEAVYLSRGERSFLGLLRGAAVTPANPETAFSPEETGVLLRLMSSDESIRSQEALETIVQNALPHVAVRSGVGMRQRDPQRNQRDLLQIVRNWVGRVFGV